jgi:hypothetical protein
LGSPAAWPGCLLFARADLLLETMIDWRPGYEVMTDFAR